MCVFRRVLTITAAAGLAISAPTSAAAGASAGASGVSAISITAQSPGAKAEGEGRAKEKAETPGVKAQAAVLMDFETGRVLFEKNSKEPMAMASTTKIMSCVIALENAGLSDTVTVSARAAGQPKVKMFLSPGERIDMESLLLALMLQSSNDAAVAIAEHVGGSVEGFAALMNEKARSIGAFDTVFVTPNGLDEGDHHSTARDMALITRYALNNKEFLRIINTKSAYVKSDRRSYDISNKNRLLSEYEGANGVKTGYTGKAGQCFVGAAKRGDMQLISVVFASGWGAEGREQKWADSKRLLNFGFDNFSYYLVVEDGGDAGEAAVERSKAKSVGAVYGGGLRLPLTEDGRAGIKIASAMPESVKAPVNKGEKLGAATVIAGADAYDVDIVAAFGVARFDLKSCAETALRGFLDICGDEADNFEIPEFPDWFPLK